jgi:hypothetical protein
MIVVQDISSKNKNMVKSMRIYYKECYLRNEELEYQQLGATSESGKQKEKTN